MRRKSKGVIPTQHALLVAWGEYAQEIGLVERLGQVKLSQKKYVHSPQTKVIELLVATLAGLAYLEDISRSAHPLDQDQAVAQAWGQGQWADYSGVSRTLQSLSASEVEQVSDQLREISQKFLAEEIEQAQSQDGRLIYDGDLTGLAVSRSSRTYPNVSYGYMNAEIHLGYQAAVVSLHSPHYGRLWLSVEHHTGNAVSTNQVEAMVLSAERQTGRKPRRRTERLEQRLLQIEHEGQMLYQRVDRHKAQVAEEHRKLSQTQNEIARLQTQVNQLEQENQARQRLQFFQKRDLGQTQALAKVEERLARSQEVLAQHQSDQGRLQQRLVQLQQDNNDNPTPIQAVFRLDAGFGTWENVALLIEMGYEVYTKGYNPRTTRSLLAQVHEPAPWVRVGPDAEMLTWPNHLAKHFCYPLDFGLERFTSDDRIKYSTLFHFSDDSTAPQSQTWFSTYNDRQMIEAGIKEDKQIFQLHHLKVRSEPAIVLQEYFVIFAANFIRWANAWLMLHASGSAIPRLDHSRLGSKFIVQVAAHTSADVIWNSYGCLLKFSNLSLLAGKQLRLPPRPHPNQRLANNLISLHTFQRFFLWLHKT